MIKKLISSNLLLILICLSVSCKKDKTDYTKFYIRMNINGKSWQSMVPYATAKVEYKENTGGFYSQFLGRSDVEIDGKTYTIDFSMPFAIKKGHFELGKIYDDGHGSSAINIGGVVNDLTGQSDFFSDTGIGYIEITDFKKGKFVSGTFACEGVTKEQQQIVISNGVFRCLLTGGANWNPE